VGRPSAVPLNNNGVGSHETVWSFTSVIRVLTGTWGNVNKPPFRLRRDGVTAESAAERVHFSHTSQGHDISLYLQCEHDAPAAPPDLELVHWSEKCVEQTN